MSAIARARRLRSASELTASWAAISSSDSPRVRCLTEGILIIRQFPYTQPLTTGLTRLAWIRQARGDGRGAWEAPSRRRPTRP